MITFAPDIEAPARRPQVGTYTPVLASDGADLAAPMQTIREIGDSAALDDAVADAFDGARIDVTGDRGYLELEMRQHGLLRSLKAAELSDGTLRYLLLISALLSPRPPTLMILNEPETSLHQDLLAPLARLVAGAASRSQIFVVTNARPLAESLLAEADCREGAWRDRDCARRAPHLDLADEVIVPTAPGERRTSSPFIRSRI
jgi:predicted ATPase